MEQHIPFVLHASCVPVKGAAKSLICDLQKQGYISIPNVLFEILEKYERKTIHDIKKAYPNNDEAIDSYFLNLEKEGFLFYTNTPELFPKLEMEWHDPSSINNAIIDLDKYSTFDVMSIIEQLIGLQCKHVQIRVFSAKPLSFYKEILKQCKSMCISSLEFIMKYDPSISFKKLQSIVQNEAKRVSFLVHTAPQKKDTVDNITFISNALTSETHCGVISANHFSVNVKSFSEANLFNSCLNKKISVDKHGNIKNCPSMSKSFGHITNTTLKDIVNNKEFKEQWSIKKDQIDVCRDCEFRYICSDCRAYIEDEKNPKSKPQKCNYNPYTGIWN